MLAAVEALLADNRVPFQGEGWDGLRDPAGYEGFRRFLAAEARSPALRARRLLLGQQLGDHLRTVLAAELGREAGEPTLGALAAMLVAALQLRERVLRTSILAGIAPDEVRREVQAVVRATFERLTAAFADLDRAR